MSQSTGKKSLEYLDYPRHIDRITNAALLAVDPYRAVIRFLEIDGTDLRIGSMNYKLPGGKIFLVAVGKAAIPMAAAAATVLDRHLHEGVVITKSQDDSQLAPLLAGYQLPDQVAIFGAGHPTPDSRSTTATTAVIDMLDGSDNGDLVLCLISGGTSALLTLPTLNLEDWRLLVQALLDSGCTINEMNSVRKRLDTIKGGGLLRHASPAPCVGLILSDVVGNPLDIIGSGPTVFNTDPPELALEILQRHRVEQALPSGVWQQVVDQLAKANPWQASETPAPANYIVGDVRQAADAAAVAAAEIGFNSHVLTAHLEGEAREVGRIAAALARDAAPGSCLVLGGETTVTIRGDGSGGRNQECALAAAIALSGVPGAIVACFATDGDDGPTDAAGAIATGETFDLAKARGLSARDYLANNDSYTFFSAAGGLIKTGPTGTNVTDLLIILKYETR